MPVLSCPPEESLHPYNDLPLPNDIRTLPLPMPPTPLNATKSGYQLCVHLTPAAAALAKEEMNKLQKPLMLSSHHRLLLSKLVTYPRNLAYLLIFGLAFAMTVKKNSRLSTPQAKIL
ncbi:hypothetical protein Dsin_022991 [Dipteronia sinensis]|uniref:Uncharacterized protein n=1 Tax=Dipteronia sinensis TaxID=43782 RepID=A0AAE0A3X4_9ROSI|nr:hypothetical protein Dsin_022991 [Dipteronia sinensis]